MSSHQPTCPTVSDATVSPLNACVVADHPEQGWSLLCNGVVRFSDGGALLPDGTSVPAPEAVGSRPARSVAAAA